MLHRRPQMTRRWRALVWPSLWIALTTTAGPAAAAPLKPVHVSLATILAHAQRRAPALSVGRARLLLGEAEVTAASLLLPEDPELEISVGPRLSSEGHAVDVEAALRQRLEIAGERGLRKKAAKHARARLQVELDRVRWEVHQRVHAAFHAALVARLRVQAAALTVEFADQLLAITNKRHAAGAVSMLHVRVAQGEAALAKQRKIKADTSYQAACLRLAEAAGWPAGSLPEPRGALAPPRAAPPLSTLVALALRHHMGLRGRRAALEEARAREALAAREAAPKPFIGLSYAREAEIAGATNHVVLGTLGLSLPLWRRNQGARARARAQASVSRARHRALQQALPLRVTRAAAALDAAARRVAVYGQGVVPAFKRNLKMIGRGFEEGKVDVLQVMVARSRFLEIQREALDTYADYYRAHAALEVVVGAEVWPNPPGAGKEVRR